MCYSFSYYISVSRTVVFLVVFQGLHFFETLISHQNVAQCQEIDCQIVVYSSACGYFTTYDGLP